MCIQYIRICVYTYVCMYVHAHTHIHTHTHTHTYIHVSSYTFKLWTITMALSPRVSGKANKSFRTGSLLARPDANIQKLR